MIVEYIVFNFTQHACSPSLSYQHFSNNIKT